MPRREIHGFEVPDEAIKVRVLTMDVPAPENGCCHRYRVERDDGASVGAVNFHEGEIAHFITDVNGMTDASVLSVLIDRFQHHAKGPLATEEHTMALKALEEAMEWVKAATEKTTEKWRGAALTA